ncbi:MAG: MBL fold metallo-hydrolase [Terrimicrobiaceae bacterium]|nr:MBL fold metallo-hydrolase [Terrimicrobiaceae bacterium]
MIRFEEFTGGMLDTNAFLLRGPSGTLLIDAPQQADSHFAREAIDALLLTHGHFDHVADAAAIQRRHACPVYYHRDTAPMVTEPNFFRARGFPLDVEPVDGGKLLAAAPVCEIAGLRFTVLEVPGHCPGSLCFYFEAERALFGGDVLFRGGIGRWDLPGGDHDLLVDGIRKKILTLPGETRVYPGHGPVTTVGNERTTNPWLRE